MVGLVSPFPTGVIAAVQLLLYQVFGQEGPTLRCSWHASSGRDTGDMLVCWYCRAVYCRLCLGLPCLVCEVIICRHCFVQQRLASRHVAPGGVSAQYREWLFSSYDQFVVSTLGSWRESTVKAYSGLMRLYRTWTFAQGLLELPASAVTLVEYLIGKAQQGVAPLTLYKHAAAQKAWHMQFSAVTGVHTEPSKDASVLMFLRRRRDLFQQRHVPKESLSETLMLRVLFTSSGTSWPMMHRKLVVAVCSLAMLRATAACSIIWDSDPSRSGVAFVTTAQGECLVRLTILCDKTQALNEPTCRIVLDGAAPGGFCLSAFLRSYLASTRLPDGLPLLSVPPTPARPFWGECNSAVISLLVKELVVSDGLQPTAYASHSLRRTGATWFRAKGARTNDDVRLLGYWLSDAVSLYTGSRESHALALLKDTAAKLDRIGVTGL